MKVSTKNITKIKEVLRYLHENYDIENSDEDIKIGDESVYICYPKDQYIEPYSVSDFLKYTKKIKTLSKVNNSTIRVDNIRQTIIDVDEYEYLYYDIPNINIKTENYTISFVSQPMYIGLIASKKSIYNETLGIYACSRYIAIEIAYIDNVTMSPLEEDEIINSLLFHISSRFEIPIKIGEFLNPDDYYIPNKGAEPTIVINNLLKYSEAMDIYIQALSINSQDIRYLYFYKIIEYYAPLVARQKSYELLNQKLDSLSVKHRNHEYLESIFSLTKQHEISIKDKELAYTVLNECIDITELYEYLPPFISIKLSKTIPLKENEYRSLNTEKIDAIKKTIAQIMYATRNDIVHAKSNYNRTGNECPADELKKFNIFMSKLCYCLIVWNNRQPDDYRI